MRSLHWFRCDLRLADNPALHAAATEGEALALYIATPKQWQEHHDAPVKLDFWRRNLELLEQELRELGIPLLYAEVPEYRDIPALLEGLLPALQVGALHCNREYPLNECRRDAEVRDLCKALGVAMHIHEDQCLLPPEAVETKSGGPFKVFTPFSRAARAQLEHSVPATLPVPSARSLPGLPSVAGVLALSGLSWPAAETGWQALWPAGEAGAAELLKRFIDEVAADYKARRDFPATAGTSLLSPRLAAGVLSAGQCWRATLEAEASEGLQCWQNELLWRDFYKHVAWHFPHVCKGYNWREDLAELPWRHDREDFERWSSGRTGIPIVDAAMRQLLETGWMHNRLRMLSAMFLSKHLLIDWRWGERWFMQHLVDGDFCANNGGWQWSASTGTDAAPYFRIFNPVTQSRRFDPQGEFIRRWLPELEELDDKSIHEPGLLRPQSYPAPMLELAFGRERALNAFKQHGR